MTLSVEPYTAVRQPAAHFGLALPDVTSDEIKKRIQQAQSRYPGNRKLDTLDQLTRDNQLLTQGEFAKLGTAMIIFSVLSELFFPVTLAVMGASLWRSWQQSNGFNAEMNHQVNKALKNPDKPLKLSTIERIKNKQPTLRKQAVWDLALYQPRDEQERVHYLKALKHFGLTQVNNTILFASSAISFFKRQYRPVSIPVMLAGVTTETWLLDRQRRQVHQGWIEYLRNMERANQR